MVGTCGLRAAAFFSREISRRWRKITPSNESAPMITPPTKKASKASTSGACHICPGKSLRLTGSVFWAANTTKKMKMMSRMAQVNAVMTFNKKGQ